MEEGGKLKKPICYQQPSQHGTQMTDYVSRKKHPEGTLEQSNPQANPLRISCENLLASDEADRHELKTAEEMLPFDIQLPIKHHEGSSLNFTIDHQHTVDFVLVWDHENSAAVEEDAYEKRKIFEANLTKEGLELEHDESMDNGLVFIKIHAPQAVLLCYSEILKFQMPMKDELCKVARDNKKEARSRVSMYLASKVPTRAREAAVKTGSFFKRLRSLKDIVKSRFQVDEKIFPRRGQKYTAVFSRDKEYLFDVASPSFFPSAIRSQIVQFIIDRNRFSVEKEDESAFGIKRLIANGAYSAAYPLHDGDIDLPGSMRYLLHHEWAALRKMLRYQPLDYVKDYFGVKIALYFAWLGFYTNMLILPTLVGFVCFAYSLVTLNSNPTSLDLCNRTDIKNCHLYDAVCVYWSHEEECLHERVTYLFDNGTMVFLAVFMSFWAAMFLELWKRYSAEITHRWDLTCFDIQEEYPRPHYLVRLAHLKKTHVNVGTDQVEPHVSFWKMKLPATILSYSVIVLLIIVAIAGLSGVLWYEVCFRTALKIPQGNLSTETKDVITVVIAALMNFAGIMLFKWIYPWFAEKLTEFEFLRTQTEFDESLSLKIYLMQFVNYYASCFYIAFFKGTSFGYFTPDRRQPYEGRLHERDLHESYSYEIYDDESHHEESEIISSHKHFLLLQRECGPTGCLMELSIQLATIMIGKQFMTTFLEIVLPLFYKSYNTLKMKFARPEPCRSSLQWMDDYTLLIWGPKQLFAEGLEMVLQYGFVTLFIAAFPLAPFFALVNNVLELRLDAKKLLTFYRRPVAQRVRDIGVWLRILDTLGKLAVVTNGCIIAFTADFIPRFVYRFMVNKDNSFSEMWRFFVDKHPWEDLGRQDPFFSQLGNATCPYSESQKMRWAAKKYTSTMFWIVLAARLVFIVVFENVVAFVVTVVRWCIPKMPKHIRDQIRHETKVIKDLIIKQETARVLRRTYPPTGSSSGTDSMLQKDAVNLMVSATGSRECSRAGGGEIPPRAPRTNTKPGVKSRVRQ